MNICSLRDWLTPEGGGRWLGEQEMVVGLKQMSYFCPFEEAELFLLF